ncbi:MAG: hypothetical protein HY904_13665 [Deltaproteobacteria bacterium]|nr:hypothetical protein [Deltaproteobacteria bacterium]
MQSWDAPQNVVSVAGSTQLPSHRMWPEVHVAPPLLPPVDAPLPLLPPPVLPEKETPPLPVAVLVAPDVTRAEDPLVLT